MEFSFGNQTAFFTIKSNDLQGTNEVLELISEDVISFSINEELGKYTSGTLILRDQDNIYSRIFRNGMRFDLSWGYKNYSIKPSITGFASKFEDTKRTGLKCVIHKPGGSGDVSGSITYNVTFYALEFLNGRQYKVFNSGIRGGVIFDLMNDLEIVQTYIDFNTQTELVTDENPIRQRENSFNLLYNLAIKWGCIFHVGYKKNGDKIGLFVDSNKINDLQVSVFMNDIIRTNRREKELYYGIAEDGNVQSFSWQHNIGEGGQGDGVRITYVNGKPVFLKFQAETQKVITYKLNPAKIKARYKNKSASEIFKLTKNYLSVEEFDEIKWAFDESVDSTAPQGLGYSINCVMKGDPTLTIPMRIIFKKGFPSPLTQDQNIAGVIKFFIRRSSHTFNKDSGYITTIDVADTYTINGSFVSFARNV